MSVIRYTNPSNTGSNAESSDRRHSCRYRVLFPDASLGWWSESSFIDVPVRLLNISLNGCMVELPKMLGRNERQSVWLRPRSIATADWTEGVIIAVRKPFVKPCRVRIAFLTHYPYESFKELVYGLDHLRDPLCADAPEHEQDHLWR
jgi:hypothetical protein